MADALLNIWNQVWPILVAILVFCFLIFFHELGHFSVAKLMGIKVNEFSLGFGPAIFKKQKGDTLYALRMIPFGGYCAMEGEDSESDDEAAFCNKAAWRRILVVAAGAVFNLILGFILVIILMSGQEAFASTVVSRFDDGALSWQTGLEIGDEIVGVNGTTVRNFSDFSAQLLRDDDLKVELTVMRDGEKTVLGGVEFPYELGENDVKLVDIDFYVAPIKKTVWSTITYSAGETVSLARTIWQSLFDIVSGKYGLNDLAGPVGTATVIGNASKLGLDRLLYIVAFITVNLGVMNLLPLPALDGGRLLFLFIEVIRRKPVPAKYEGFIHAAGFALLLLLITVITFNDIRRLIFG